MIWATARKDPIRFSLLDMKLQCGLYRVLMIVFKDENQDKKALSREGEGRYSVFIIINSVDVDLA